MTKIPNIENKTVTDFFTACKVHLKSNPHGRCAVEYALFQALAAEREAGAREYKQFVLNVLAGIDIADGECNTKAIRLAIASRIIE